MNEKIPQPEKYLDYKLSQGEIDNAKIEEEHRQRVVEAAKHVTFPELIDSSRPISDEYKRIIEQAKKDPLQGCLEKARFSECWFGFLDNPSRFPQTQEFFRKHLKSCPLIDLGGGKFSMMHSLARESGAPLYINVDQYAIDQDEYDENSNPPMLQTKRDMLEFVTQLRDNSASFVLNGIDDFIIPDSEYQEALVQELERTTKPGGIIFGVESVIDSVIQDKIWGGRSLLRARPIDLIKKKNQFEYENRFVYEKLQDEG